jgi:hypothetical protein
MYQRARFFLFPVLRLPFLELWRMPGQVEQDKRILDSRRYRRKRPSKTAQIR